jgi:hypothetical protein
VIDLGATRPERVWRELATLEMRAARRSLERR